MRVNCSGCTTRFDDELQWTLCPHASRPRAFERALNSVMVRIQCGPHQAEPIGPDDLGTMPVEAS